MQGFTTIIGGTHQISEELWAISLIRRAGKDHAYLVLEGVEEKVGRVMKDAHLVIKEGTANKKAEIILRDIPLEQLIKVGEGCSSYTWSLSKAQAEVFIARVRDEVERSNRNEVNYVLAGNSAVNGLLGKSLEAAGSDEWKTASEDKSTGSSMDMLLRDGHNCCSWAIAMVRAMELKFTTTWKTFVIVRPKYEVNGAAHDGDRELTSGEKVNRCLVM